jgi:hypothetical protein
MIVVTGGGVLHVGKCCGEPEYHEEPAESDADGREPPELLDRFEVIEAESEQSGGSGTGGQSERQPATSNSSDSGDLWLTGASGFEEVVTEVDGSRDSCGVDHGNHGNQE